MPVIHTHVSVKTTPEQREALKAAYGKAITAVPGKSEGWLMCPFEDDMPIYFGGSDDAPAAYVEVNVFGRSVPGSAWEKLNQVDQWPRSTASSASPRTAPTSATPPPPTGAGTAVTSELRCDGIRRYIVAHGVTVCDHRHAASPHTVT